MSHEPGPAPRPAPLERSRLHRVAQVKRLLELLEGDPDFRELARTRPGERPHLLEGAGVDLHASQLRAFWGLLDSPDLTSPRQGEIIAELRQHPAGAPWIEWVQEGMQRLEEASRQWQPPSASRVAAWRRRQIARASGEALPQGDAMLFPLLAFELSHGCSLQCRFCALDPPELQGHFAYTPENRSLWRGMLAVSRELFADGARAALCYHATEPTDNPDYFSFLEDFHEVIGVYPQTTTAHPLKDLAWTRRLPRLRGASVWPHDRLSILSLPTLRRLHQTFSADELLRVELVFQNPGSLSRRVLSGRALQHTDRREHAAHPTEEGGPAAPLLTPGSIECVCGWVVNLVTRTVRLVSPCRASAAQPLGHIVHAEEAFDDSDSFGSALETTIRDGTKDRLGPDDRLAFRRDLVFESLPDGFALLSPYRRQTVRGHSELATLGRLIQSGGHTMAEVTRHLTAEGMPPVESVAWPERLFQSGLLEEE